MVQDDHLPPGARQPPHHVQVLALARAPRAPQGLRLRHRGAPQREGGGAGQGGVLQRHHLGDHRHQPRPLLRHRLLQRHPAPRRRPHPHLGRHLRPRPRRPRHHGYALNLRQRRLPVGQSRHLLDRRGEREPRLHRVRRAHLGQVRQLQHHRGRLRHQPAASRQVRARYLRGRPLRVLQDHRLAELRSLRSRHGPQDPQGDHDHPVQARGPAHRPPPRVPHGTAPPARQDRL